jgi:hypothetical protein
VNHKGIEGKLLAGRCWIVIMMEKRRNRRSNKLPDVNNLLLLDSFKESTPFLWGILFLLICSPAKSTMEKNDTEKKKEVIRKKYQLSIDFFRKSR